VDEKVVTVATRFNLDGVTRTVGDLVFPHDGPADSGRSSPASAAPCSPERSDGAIRRRLTVSS
jgi:hypothetical protein